MLKYLNLLFLLVILGFGIGFLTYSGLFTGPKIGIELGGPFVLLVKDQKGDYRQSGESIGPLIQALDAAKLPYRAGAALYLDDPGQVKLENLRSQAGVWVDSSARPQIEAAVKLPDYHWVEYPAEERAVARFPFRNHFSMAMGIYKVYPAFFDFLDAQKIQRGATLELYLDGVEIQYWNLPLTQTK